MPDINCQPPAPMLDPTCADAGSDAELSDPSSTGAGPGAGRATVQEAAATRLLNEFAEIISFQRRQRTSASRRPDPLVRDVAAALLFHVPLTPVFAGAADRTS